MNWKTITIIGVLVLIVGGVGTGWYFLNVAELDIYRPMYVEHCANCHGDELQGTPQGVSLLAGELTAGDTHEQLQHSIRFGHPQLGHPAFAQALTDVEVKGLAIYVGERRMGQHFTDFAFDRHINIPTNTVTSDLHNFVIERVIDGLDPLVFSIEPMPDGNWLLTEKERGLSIIHADGTRSEPIQGTPVTGSSIDVMGVQYGSGWLLDVALHPNYAANGWIYLHYTHLLGESNTLGPFSSTMNRLDRGRIVEGVWTDVETLWQAPEEFYQPTPDTGAGGRIAFDDDGHVFLSMGIKSTDGSGDITAQDLTKPYGKIHRINDDGTIPIDNPFVPASANKLANTPPSALPSIWSYGHRSPQGLEWHATRQRVWNSEMGPRGGDELNELLPGRNYGWPFYSQGLEYSGEYVERHKLHASEFDASDVEHTLVNITPSPAISSFVFYNGQAFVDWQGDVLIGSLKGSSLFRMRFQGNEHTHTETLLKDLGRIRDIEVGFDGLVYLLLEAEEGSQVVRLRPIEENNNLAS